MNGKLPSALRRNRNKNKNKITNEIHMLIQEIVLHSKWYYATAQILTQTISFAFFYSRRTPSLNPLVSHYFQ